MTMAWQLQGETRVNIKLASLKLPHVLDFKPEKKNCAYEDLPNFNINFTPCQGQTSFTDLKLNYFCSKMFGM